MPQGSGLDPLLFLVYVNYIWRKVDSSIRRYADDCINENYIEKLQKDLVTLWEWAVENWMKINPGNSKVIRFSRVRVKYPLGYSLGDQKIPEASSCK